MRVARLAALLATVASVTLFLYLLVCGPLLLTALLAFATSRMG